LAERGAQQTRRGRARRRKAGASRPASPGPASALAPKRAFGGRAAARRAESGGWGRKVAACGATPGQRSPAGRGARGAPDCPDHFL